jgi:hypothetical protein
MADRCADRGTGNCSGYGSGSVVSRLVADYGADHCTGGCAGSGATLGALVRIVSTDTADGECCCE